MINPPRYQISLPHRAGFRQWRWNRRHLQKMFGRRSYRGNVGPRTRNIIHERYDRLKTQVWPKLKQRVRRPWSKRPGSRLFWRQHEAIYRAMGIEP